MAFHAWLSGLFTRTNDDGSYKFTNEQIEDLVAAVVFTTGFEPGTLPARVAQAVVGLAGRAGLDPSKPIEKRSERLTAYFEANPLPDELLVDFRQALQSEAATSSDDAGARSFLRFLDDGEKKFAPRERPAGTRPGGALGFFLAKKDLG